MSAPSPKPTVTDSTPTERSRLKLLAVMEATTVTGAAKSMLDFCRSARDLLPHLPDLPTIETSIVTFDRRPQLNPGRSVANERSEAEGVRAGESEFVAAAHETSVEVDVVRERFRFDPRAIRGLRRAIKLRRPDIVLTHHVKSHFLMKCSRLWHEFPWVAFHHGYTTTDLKMRAYNYLDRWSLPTPAGVITVCGAFADELTEVGVPRERIFVRHNAIGEVESPNEAAVEALRAELKLTKDERLVLAIGRLSREKAHTDLIAAFSRLLRIEPEINARLIVVGDGPERARLEAEAATLGVSHRTLFAGQRREVSSFYALADLMALPSHSEGSPYVLLEAMAAGVPVVATAVGGVPEMVEHERSALLVPARDPQAMAEALGRVLTDRELAATLARNASDLIATRFSPEAYLRSMIEIYQGVLSR